MEENLQARNQIARVNKNSKSIKQGIELWREAEMDTRRPIFGCVGAQITSVDVAREGEYRRKHPKRRDHEYIE
jgi:hypothetical protein